MRVSHIKIISRILTIVVSAIFAVIFPNKVSANVLINEFSSYDSSDWVEIYANEDTDISGWILRDSAQTKVATVSGNVMIGPSKQSQFYVFENFGNRLNVDDDTIKLYRSDDTTLENEIDYGRPNQVCAPGQGQSVGRVDNGNTIERFAGSTKGFTNAGSSLAPCPTSTPSPTNPPTSAPTTSPTNPPTASPSPTPVKTKTPTPKPSPTPEVLGENTGTPSDISELRGSLAEPSATPEPVVKSGSNFPYIAVAFIVAGLGLMGGAGYFAYKKQKQNSSATINE